VDELESTDNLGSVLFGSLFREEFGLANMVEEVASLDEVHDKVEFLGLAVQTVGVEFGDEG
jgi:hypothetical protein